MKFSTQIELNICLISPIIGVGPALTSTPSHGPPRALPRNAIVSNLLQQAVKDGRTGLKEHGAASKLDNNTCLACFAAPVSFQLIHSLYRPFVFFEECKALGCSAMHLKIR